MDFKIWPPYEAFYIQSMLFNTVSAVASMNRLSEICRALSAGETTGTFPEFDEDEFLDDLQNIVAQGAAMSRYFWPTRKGHEDRAELLRTVFSIDDGSALKNRDLRNAIEHFDEKLDQYLADGIVGYIFPQYLGPLPENSGGVPCHIFRAYYTDVSVFELLGKRYEIEPIADEIARIHRLLTTFDKNGGRFCSSRNP